MRIQLSMGSGLSSPPTDSSELPVAFHGRTDIQIPTGTRIINDLVALPLPAVADLWIIVCVPAQTIHVLSFHSDSQQISWITRGNVAGSPADTHTRMMTSWYFLRGVDVAAVNKAVAAGVAIGDSSTDGAHSSIDQNHRWPDFSCARLRSDTRDANLGIINAGH